MLLVEHIKNKPWFILILFHVVGLLGILSPYKDWFLLLTPFNLILSLTVVLLNHRGFTNKFILFCIGIFIAGYLVEWLGIHTGLIFGEYSYGKTLGPKLFFVPVVIGVNWLMLVYSTGVVSQDIIKSTIPSALLGAVMMTGLDFLIEPVAIKYDFWSWANRVPPLQNFIAWYVISFVFLFIFNKTNVYYQNKASYWLLGVQLTFFSVLFILQ